MSTEENKARVHRFYEEVFNRKNTAALDEFIDPQAVDHSAPASAPGGIEGARQFAGMFLAAFPDVRFVVEDLIAEGDQVVARLTQICRGLEPGNGNRWRAAHRQSTDPVVCNPAQATLPIFSDTPVGHHVPDAKNGPGQHESSRIL